VLNWLQKPGPRMAIASVSIFLSFALVCTLHRYYSFYASFDQGIFNQVFWNGIHGNFFESSLSSSLSTNVVHGGDVPDVSYHRLGQHFTPALLLWLPIYALFPSAATLTVLQVTLLGLAGLVLYALARQHLPPQKAGMITLAYYAANAVLGPTLGNFHDNCQLPLFAFGLLLAMEKRLWWLFWLLAVLVLAIREDSGIVLFGVGFYLVVSGRYPRVGLAVCTLSFAYMLMLTNLIMPLFSADISRRFMMERFGQYATEAEASTLDIIWGMISNPLRLVQELFTPFFKTIKYLLGQWLPLAFVPAFSPASWCIAGFPLLKLFLAQGESVLAINIRYALTPVPGLFYGAILWWAGKSDFRLWWFNLYPQPHPPSRPTLKGWGYSYKARLRGLHNDDSQEHSHPGRPTLKGWGYSYKARLRGLQNHEELRKPSNISRSVRGFWTVCIVLSLLFTLTSNPNRTFYFLIPDSFQPWVYVSLTRQWQHVGHIRPMLAEIPADASVAATTYIVSHLSGRREIVRFPAQFRLRNDDGQVVDVDYCLADLWQLKEYQVAFKHDRLQLRQAVQLIDDLLASNTYGARDFADGVILLQKGTSSEEEVLAAWRVFSQEIIPFSKISSYLRESHAEPKSY